MENNLIKYEFDKDGTIKSIYDKEFSRELIDKNDKANLFSVYYDQPNAYDAWDIEIFYEKQFVEHAKCRNISELSDGPLRQTMTFDFTISNSSITQKVVLEKNKKRLDFITTVNWTERHRMLRTAFHMNLNATKASFDVQYGYAERTTHRNTSWDLAKFEVVAHKYADISEPDYGIALLNDCKYGYKVIDSTIDLCLLRSPTHPDPDADRGAHEFTYSILPHEHSLVDSNVIEEASFLNRKPFVMPGYKSATAALPCKILSDGISLEVLKKAEKENCLVIRLVETKGKNSEGELVFDRPDYKLIETDIMEWTYGKAIKCRKNHTIKLKPFEIATFKIK
jgi:alpha-mannosidase